jgi:hypothetical protein
MNAPTQRVHELWNSLETFFFNFASCLYSQMMYFCARQDGNRVSIPDSVNVSASIHPPNTFSHRLLAAEEFIIKLMGVRGEPCATTSW